MTDLILASAVQKQIEPLTQQIQYLERKLAEEIELRMATDNALAWAQSRCDAAEAELAATQDKLARLEALPPDFGHDGLRWKIGAAMLRNIDAASPQTDRTAALYHAFRAGLRAALKEITHD